MSWKKNAFSYVCWFLYAVLTGTALLCLTGYVSETLGFSVYWGILFAVLYALCAAVVVILLHRAGIEVAAVFAGKRILEGLLKAILLVILSTIGLYLRLRLIDGLGVIDGSRAAVIMAELICQIAVAFLLFFLLKRLSGYVCGLISFGFVMCSPFVVERLTQDSPEMLYLFICLAVFSIITIGYRKKLRPTLFFLFGALAGFVTHVDLTGIIVFGATLALIFVTRDYGAVIGRKLAALLCSMAGAAAGFLGCIFIQSLLDGCSFVSMLEVWFSVYLPEPLQLPAVVGNGGVFGEAFVLIGLMVLGIFSFWYNREEESLSLGVLLLSVLVMLSYFGMVRGIVPGTLGIYLLMAALAGVGVQQCMSRVCVPQELLIPKEMEDAENAMKYDTTNQINTEQSLTEQSAEVQSVTSREDFATEVVQEETQQELPDTKPAIQFIENPLPLPKKHEKRVFDFSLQLTEETDDFDVAVEDNDDFDI